MSGRLTRLSSIAVVTVALAVLPACSGDDDPDPAPRSSSPVTTAPRSTASSSQAETSKAFRNVTVRANRALQKVIPSLAGVQSASYENRTFSVYFTPAATAAQRAAAYREIRQLIRRHR